jgi:hypothetical protein
MTVRFLTAVDTIDVPDDKAHELARRLRGASAAKKITEPDGRGVRFTDDEKRVVLDELAQWIRDEGVSAPGRELGDLRHELMRDLRVPPFDT